MDGFISTTNFGYGLRQAGRSVARLQYFHYGTGFSGKEKILD